MQFLPDLSSALKVIDTAGVARYSLGFNNQYGNDTATINGMLYRYYYRAFYKFDFSSLPSNAKIRAYTLGGANSNPDVYSLSNFLQFGDAESAMLQGKRYSLDKI